jgi:hypothetical protein
MKTVSLIPLLICTLICCGPSVQELKMYELKENSGRLFVPKPFTICYSKNQLDTTGANLISSYINQKMNFMMRDKLEKEKYEFATYQEYIEYGKELSLLVSDLKRAGMDNVVLSDSLLKFLDKGTSDLCLLVFTVANPKSKGRIVGNIMATVGIGISVGLLTGFSPIIGPGIVSSEMNVIIYSKREGRVISYENEEDKDNPLEPENTYEQFETLFSNFIEAAPRRGK